MFNEINKSKRLETIIKFQEKFGELLRATNVKKNGIFSVGSESCSLTLKDIEVMGIILKNECNVKNHYAMCTRDSNWWHFNVDATEEEIASALDQLYAGLQEKAPESTSVQPSCP